MTIKSPCEEVLVEVEDGVVTATLNRPDTLNALTPPLMSGLAEIGRQVSQDEDAKVLIITGAGKGFCSGADVTGAYAEVYALAKGEPAQEVLKRWSYERLVNPVAWDILGIWNCTKPTIAAINGVCVAAGLIFAAACDLRIASETARFGLLFSQVNLIPDCGGTYLMPRLIGIDKALEMAYTNSIVDAQEALRMGMVTRVVPHNDLMKYTKELARKIATGPSLALLLTKRGMREGLHNNFRTQLDFESYAQNLCENTEDFREGVRAFGEKRPPKFKGR